MISREEINELVYKYNNSKNIKKKNYNIYRSLAKFIKPEDYYLIGRNNSYNNNENELNIKTISNKALVSKKKFSSFIKAASYPDAQKYHFLKVKGIDQIKANLYSTLSEDQQKQAEDLVNQVEVYLDILNDRLFEIRDDTTSKFYIVESQLPDNILVYGFNVVYAKLSKSKKGIYYDCINPNDIYFTIDEENNIDVVFQSLFLTAIEAKNLFGIDNLPENIKRRLLNNESDLLTRKDEYLKVVCKRSDYDPEKIFDEESTEYRQIIISTDNGNFLIEDVAFISNPFIITRNRATKDNYYGIPLAKDALTALEIIEKYRNNSLKTNDLKANPPVLATDDIINNGGVSLTPKAINYGLIDENGREKIKFMQIPDSKQDIEYEMQKSEAEVDAVFMIDLYNMFLQNRQTVDQIMQLRQDRVDLTVEIMKMIQKEFLEPIIARSLSIMEYYEISNVVRPDAFSQLDLEYTISYSTPVSKALNIGDIQGFQTLNGIAKDIAQVDPEVLDYMNYERAFNDIADILHVPNKWLSTSSEVEAKREQRQNNQDINNLTKAAPAISSVIKNTQQGQ